MDFLDKHFGRLGNRMFQSAFLYAYARDHGIDHYYQDPKFFEKYASEIKQLFGEGISYDDRVSIHARQGDYVNNSFYINLLNSDYYQEAQKLFSDDRFLIFSDDIGICKKAFIGDQYDFSEGRSEEEDLKLMASCKSNIIANSSFSYWAAWLNPNPDKKVIAPKQWYSDGIERTKCPEQWIRL